MRAAWFWIDRWRQSSAYCDLSAEAQGCFRNLLDELWLRDGTLPFDEKSLAKACGDFEAWPRVRAVVLARFYKTPDGWRNKTHDEVSAQSKAFKERQAEKGKRRAGQAARTGGKFQPTHQPDNQPDASRESSRITSPETSLPSPSPSPSKDTDQRAEYREPPMPNPTPVPSWESVAKATWSKYLGGENDYVFADLVPVVRRHREKPAMAAWDRYCREQAGIEGGKFASARSFAAKPGPWLKKPEEGPPMHTAEWLMAKELRTAR